MWAFFGEVGIESTLMEDKKCCHYAIILEPN
jgi:hypothetical protein